MLCPQKLLHLIVEFIPEIMEKEWEAKKCIVEMKEKQCNNWKQTEWVGWYFQFLMDNKKVSNVEKFKYFICNTKFNGCIGKNIIDYKTSSVNDKENIILNDKEAIDRVVNKYKELGFLILKGDAEKEKDKELDEWRKSLTGKSKYVKRGEKSGRKHRKLKTKFFPKKLLYVSINQENIKYLKDHAQGKNSNGKPRPLKYSLPQKMIEKFIKTELNLEKQYIDEKEVRNTLLPPAHKNYIKEHSFKKTIKKDREIYIYNIIGKTVKFILWTALITFLIIFVLLHILPIFLIP